MEPTKEPVNGPTNLIARMQARVIWNMARKLEPLVEEELKGHRPDCPECGRPMTKNHSYRRAVESSWGELEVAVPVYRCRQCAVMVSNAWMLEDQGEPTIEKIAKLSKAENNRNR